MTNTRHCPECSTREGREISHPLSTVFYQIGPRGKFMNLCRIEQRRRKKATERRKREEARRGDPMVRLAQSISWQ